MAQPKADWGQTWPSLALSWAETWAQLEPNWGRTHGAAWARLDASWSARLSGGAGCSRLVTTWFGLSENQKNTFKIVKTFFRQKREIARYKKI